MSFPAQSTSQWISGPVTDTLLAWAWLPVYVATFVLTKERASSDVVALLGWAFAVSVLHQPLTLLVAYGDKEAWARHRRLFVLVPLLALPLLAWAVYASFWLVLPIATVWQLFHTQQQRYGILRIYSIKNGGEGPALDRAMTYAPFIAALALVTVSPATRAQLDLFGGHLGASKRRAIVAVLERADWATTVVAPLIAIALVVIIVRMFRGPHHVGKTSYLLAGLALMAGLVCNPIAGLIAYLVAHAFEYFIVVHMRLATRVFAARMSPKLVSGIALLVFMSGFALVDAKVRAALLGRSYRVATTSIGLLHFVYDGFIWKNRRGRAKPV